MKIFPLALRAFVGAVILGGLLPGGRAAAPQFPSREEVARMAQDNAGSSQALATAPALTVDTSSREAVRQFYLALCRLGDDVPIGWTGNFSSGDGGASSSPGDTSAAFKDAVLLRINAMRALAGVPAAVTFSPAFSAKAQQAALMMSVNNSLSHNPPSNWKVYTADGAEAARNSNLSLGDNGPTAITRGYIGDSGSNNAAVGHRRWILYPQTQIMGTGDVPASAGFLAANATWIIDTHVFDARPATRNAYVAWPAPGYFPAPLIFPRWSFSYADADFSGATVTLTRDGAPVAVALEAVTTGAGENTLVWVYGGLDASQLVTPTVTTDSVFHVTISNVLIGGAPRSFQYDVTAFDPARTAGDTVVVALSGPATPAVGAANAYTATRPTFADTLQWRSLQVDSAIPTYDAESGLDGLAATTTGTYNPRTTATVGAGAASYQLTSDSFQNQYLLAPETFYAPTTSSPQLTFLSRLGFATADQTARVQISTDDGASWTDLYTQVGNGSTNTPTESGFTARSVSLATVAGLTFKIRFAYTFSTGNAFTQADPGVGWFLDNITLTGVQRVAATSAVSSTSATSITFTPAAAGAVGLQARGALFGTYPMAWGPVLVVNASSAAAVAPSITTPPASATAMAGASVTIAVVANGTAPLTYQWLKNTAPISGATGATYTIASVTSADAGNYAVTVSNSAGSVTSSAATLAVDVTNQPPATFANIATRAYCTTGNGVTIGGFVISGRASKRVLVRAVGPSLTAQGIGANEVLLDPTIEVHDALHGNSIVATNDNLADNANAADIVSVGSSIGANPLLGSDTKSSALLLTLAPGIYSFVVNGKNATSGIVLLEVYDADAVSSGANFANIATRAYCTTGNGVTIGGFVISGSRAKQVLMRAVGPTLTTQGIGQAEVLLDPAIELHDAIHGNALVATNDNWGDNANAADITATGARIGATPFAQTDTKSSALLLTLQPGVYSFVASGKAAAPSGIVLIEVYDAD